MATGSVIIRSLHQCDVNIRQIKPTTAQMAAIIRKWLGTGWLSLYKNNGPAITMTVIKIVPPRLLKRERSVRWFTSSVITLERLPNGTLTHVYIISYTTYVMNM